MEKVPNATKTSQFRPITIFSLIYRTWSSIRSKQCLQHLIDHVPTRCYGNLPGRHAGQVWWGILQSIEDSNCTGNHLTGAMIDIVKCFNALPRCPLLAVCSHLGIHDGIIKAWMSGLAQMTRRFSIRGGVGPPLKSSTGFAEGCGLSVVAMVSLWADARRCHFTLKVVVFCDSLHANHHRSQLPPNLAPCLVSLDTISPKPTKNATDFPQNVAFGKGNPLFVQGNLG